MALQRDPRLIAQAIAFARRQLGIPYQWGGTSRSTGFDCSGLVYAAYRAAGYSGIGRTTYDQIKQGIPVSAANLKPGDVVFPSVEHEGLYIGNGMVLEAPHTGDHVKIVPLSSFGFMTARRLVGGGGGIIPPKAIAGTTSAGLPVASPNPAGRQPNIAAALAALARVRPVQINQSNLTLKTPQQALGDVFGLNQTQTPQAFQPVQPDAPKPLVSPGGMSTENLQSSLDSARKRLLGSLG